MQKIHKEEIVKEDRLDFAGRRKLSRMSMSKR